MHPCRHQVWLLFECVRRWLLLTSAGEIGSTGFCNGTCCSGVCNYDLTTGHTICCATEFQIHALLAWPLSDPEPRLTMYEAGFHPVDQARVD